MSLFDVLLGVPVIAMTGAFFWLSTSESHMRRARLALRRDRESRAKRLRCGLRKRRTS